MPASSAPPASSPSTLHSDWLVPDWPAPARVHAVFTTRAGGISGPPFDQLNLGDHVGDASRAVAANRVTLATAMGAHPVFLNQVHGMDVLTLTHDTPNGGRADACVTTEPGLACTVMVADCLPVLLAHARGGVVAAAHAGWRGLAGRVGAEGVLEATFAEFKAVALMKYGSSAIDSIANDTLAWLGPCIGPQCFEVGDEVREAFVAVDTRSATMFVPHAQGKWLANLPGLARLRLRALGITRVHGNDASPAWCTVSQPSRFFSHRRDSMALGSTGRMAASIWIDGAGGAG